MDLSQSQQLVESYDFITKNEFENKVKEVVKEELKEEITKNNRLIYVLLFTAPIVCTIVHTICKKK